MTTKMTLFDVKSAYHQIQSEKVATTQNVQTGNYSNLQDSNLVLPMHGVSTSQRSIDVIIENEALTDTVDCGKIEEEHMTKISNINIKEIQYHIEHKSIY